MNQMPAGWYADQNDEGQERFWDGTRWTAQLRPVVKVEATAAVVTEADVDRSRRNNRQGLIIFGAVIGSLLILAVGLFVFRGNGQTEQSPAQGSAISKESDFLNRTADKFPTTSGPDLLNLGHLVCDSFASGSPGWQVIGLMIGKGLSNEQAISLTSASVIDFCPQYKDLALQK